MRINRNQEGAYASIVSALLSRLSIRQLFFWAVFPFLLVSYLLIAWSLYYVLHGHTKNLILDQTNQNIYDKAERFDTYFDELYESTDYLLYNPQMQKLLQLDVNLLNHDQAELHRSKVIGQFEQGLSRYSYASPRKIYINKIYLKDAFGEIFVSDASYSLREERINRLFDEVRIDAVGAHGKPIVFHKDSDILYFARTVYKANIDHSNDQIGLLVIELERKLFPQVIGNIENRSNISYALVDDSDNVISNLSPLKDSDFKQLLKGKTARFGNTEYSQITYSSKYGNFRIIGIINESGLYSEFNKTYFTVLMLILLSIAFVVTAIIVASQVVRGRFRKFINKLNETDVINESAMIHMATGGEFQELEHVYNTMLQRINRLGQSLNIEQQAVKKAELKAFQAQINPHFLYNTLDCINSLVDFERYEDAKNTVTALGKLMRMSIKEANIIPISKELDYVRQYLFIQKMRYQDRALFFIEVPDELLSYSIPKLVLQPLLENAILHGISDRTEQGVVALFGEKTKDCILFHVKDNGCGIPEELRNRINNFSFEGNINENEQPGIGLLNIQKRIQLLYGDEYGVTVKPVTKGGTSVTVRIPC